MKKQILILISCIFLILLVSNVSAWWDNNWAYNKPIQIYYEGMDKNITNYQVLINVTHIAGKMNNDFTDIRFIWQDTTELNWTSNWSSSGLNQYGYRGVDTSMYVMVQVPVITNATDTTINMYYGNAGASLSEVHPFNVYDIFMDFKGLYNGSIYGTWTLGGNSAWNMNGSKFYHINNVNTGATIRFNDDRVNGSYSGYPNRIFDISTFETGENIACFSVLNNYTAMTSAYICNDPGTSNAQQAYKWITFDYQNYGKAGIGQGNTHWYLTTKPTSNVWHNQTVILYGQNGTGFVDGVWKGGTASAVVTPYFWTSMFYGGAGPIAPAVTNIFVRKYTYPEPIVVFDGEELSTGLTIANSVPSNNTNITSSSMTFGCNATSSGQNITSIVLNVTGTSTWTQTNIYTGTNISVNATFINSTLLKGNYRWNCIGYGNLGINSSSQIWNFNKTINLFTSLSKSFRITEFIDVSGNSFTLAGALYHIIGANFYYAIDYMTNHTYTDNGEEINGSNQDVYEVLNEMQSLNMNVVRTWGLMQGGNNNGTNATWDRYKAGGHWNFAEVGYPGNYSEEYFLAFDKFLYECSRRDIRPQITLINNWNAYGGMQWYLSHASTSNKTYENSTYLSDNWWTWHDQFYHNDEANEYFQNAINYTLNRNNTITGIKYKDDPTIFSWMIANEPRAKTPNHTMIANWCNNTATFIKSNDPNHLVTCGIESLGFNETWGEGSDMIETYNNTASDYITFATNTGQWGYMVERVETSSDNVFMCSVSSSNCDLTNANVRAFWSSGHNYTYNSRYWSGVPYWFPKQTRHSYDNWVEQNVKQANAIGKPVMLQELVVGQAYSDVVKDEVYQNIINNFYSTGGDGLMFWTMNSDSYNRASSTSETGNQDDGYGFYLSNNVTLKALSASTISAFDYAVSNNYVTLLNNYKYDFSVNISDSVNNCSLWLNVSNGTTWTNYIQNQTNTTTINAGENYVFTQQFVQPEYELYWYISCTDSVSTYSTEEEYLLLQDDMPLITQISPENNQFFNSNLTLGFNVTNSLSISNCELYVNDVLNQTDSTVSLNVPQSFNVNFVDGIYNWSVKCTDIGNNIGYSSTSNFTIDKTPPTGNIFYPNNQTYNKDITELNYTALDTNLQACEYSTDGITYAPNVCGANLTGLTSNQGSNTWYIKLNDSANNVKNLNVTFSRDDVAPIVSYANNTQNSSVYINQNFIYINTTWTESNFYNITFRLFRTATIELTNTTIAYSHNFTGLSDGFYEYNVTVCDIFSNCGSTLTRNITLDTTNPNATLLTPTNNSYVNNITQNFTVNLFDRNNNLSCYQETANVSTDCGGLGTGTYSVQPYYFYINYTKPSDSTSAIWQVQHGNYSTYNVSILDSCFDYGTDIQLRFYSESNEITTGMATSYGQCYNGSWNNITQSYYFDETSVSVLGDVLPRNELGLYDGDWNTQRGYNEADNRWAVICYGSISCDTYDHVANIYEEAIIWTISTGGGIKNATLNIYNQSGLVNQTSVTYSEGTLQRTLGIVVNLIDGIYNWFYQVFDWAGNSFISENNTLTIDTTFPLINFTYPTDNGLYIARPYLFINVSSTDTNLANITIFLYNSTKGIVKNVTTTSNSNYYQFLDLTSQIHYFNATATDLANNKNYTELRNISVNPSLYLSLFSINLSNRLFQSSNILLNVSTGSATTLSYCNFTLINPSGNKIFEYQNYTVSTDLNIMFGSNYTLINQSGNWNVSANCINSLGISNSVSRLINIDSYNLNTNPTTSSVKYFQALLSKTELNGFNITLWDNALGEVRYSVTTNIHDSENFTINIPTSIILNSSDNSTSFVNVQFKLNASSDIANGSYVGNINFTNSTYGLSYSIPFSYGIYPPSGIPTIWDAVTFEKCTSDSSSSCVNHLTLSYGDSTTITYFINNTGEFPLTNCTANFTDSLKGVSWASFSNPSFNLPIGSGIYETVTFNPPSGSFYGNFYVSCAKGSLLDTPQSSSSNPYTDIFVATHVSDPAGGGGGAGGGTKVNVVAINLPTKFNKTLTNLSLAIIYSKINEYCNNFSISSSNCEMTKSNKDKILLELQNLNIDITYDELIIWIERYNYNDLFSFQIDESFANKYNLFVSTVKAGVIVFEINPKRIDTFFIIMGKDSKFNYISTSNKLIDSIEIIQGGENMKVTKKETSSVLTYKPENLDFSSKVINGRIAYTSSSGEVFIQDVQIRAIYLFSPTSMITLGVIILGAVGIFTFRKKIKNIFKKHD